ncbi:hypothetical protein SAMN02745124_03683 [Desulfofustis glycolicus DSM 9705]|uniref:Uncharacterized protein n=1 Tax=Desulfofustis glycolicus DSM 9705 TaxID=1121409 RepID=A0A1M5Y856_9BACT|nr:hypothetical protein SAMN02745124_03683 [Desulfofustis glycolicus DSM 9705]
MNDVPDCFSPWSIEESKWLYFLSRSVRVTPFSDKGDGGF